MELKAGYKQTEVGVIPVDWVIKPIGSVLKIKHGKSQHDVACRDGNYPILATGGEIGRTNTALYNKPSVLIGRKGTIDVPRFMDSPFWTVDTLFYSEISEKVEPKFIYYKFCLIDWYSYNEASGVPSLNAATIEKINQALPPTKAEQTAIANVLSDTDALIQSLTRLIAKKRQIKQGAMQTLLNPYENGRLKAGWVVKKLGDFLDYEQPTKYLVANTEYNDNNNTPVLTAGKTFILGYTHEDFGIFNTGLPIIIFDDFTTASKFVTFPFKAKSSAMKILKRKNKEVNIRFIFEIMQRIVFPLGDHKRHWIGEFQHLDIHIPEDEAEQTRIATILSDMDTEITALESKLSKYQQIKQGMMQNLLTGQIRLVSPETETNP